MKYIYKVDSILYFWDLKEKFENYDFHWMLKNVFE